MCKLLFCLLFTTNLAISSARAEPIVIAALGDSLTQGYGLPIDKGFIAQLQEWLDTKDANITIINAGVSGDTTAGGLSRIEWTLTPDIDAVIVELGGNDMMRGIMPNDSRQNLDGILSVTKARDLPTLLVGLPSATNFGADFKTNFDAIFPELALKFDTLLYPDFFQSFREELKDPTALSKYMQGDAIHPNESGVMLIVEDFGPLVLDLADQAKH